MSALDRIEARADAATDGPWVARTTGRSGGDHWYVCDQNQSVASLHASDGEDEDQRQPDAEFIAAARTDVPRLVAALRAAESVADRMGEFTLRANGSWARELRAAITDALGEDQ